MKQHYVKTIGNTIHVVNYEFTPPDFYCEFVGLDAITGEETFSSSKPDPDIEHLVKPFTQIPTTPPPHLYDIIGSLPEQPQPQTLPERVVAAIPNTVVYAGTTLSAFGDDTQEMNHYVLHIAGQMFDYFQGLGINTEPTATEIMGCLLDDARFYLGLTDALDLVEVFGFDAKQARQTWGKLVENFDKLSYIELSTIPLTNYLED